MCCYVIRSFHSLNRKFATHVYLDKSVHPSAAWSLSCSCTQSCRWCCGRSARSRRSEAHTRRYLRRTGWCTLAGHFTLRKARGSWRETPRLTFACFSVWLQREADRAAAAHACGCVFTGAVAPPIVHCAGFWNYSTQGECVLRYSSTSNARSLGKQSLY